MPRNNNQNNKTKETIIKKKKITRKTNAKGKKAVVPKLKNKKDIKSFVKNVAPDVEKELLQMLLEKQDKIRVSELLTEDAPTWLTAMGKYPLESMKCLIEKLKQRIKPYFRGSEGLGKSVSIDVEDEKMESFLKALRKRKDMGSWTVHRGVKTIGGVGEEKRKVKRIKFCTSSKKDLIKFFSSFKGENANRILEQHYMAPMDLEYQNYVWIDTDTMKNKKNPLEWFEKEIQVRKEQSWTIGLITVGVYSCKIQLGSYIRSGAVGIEEGKKPKPAQAFGKFTIEYIPSICPSAKLGTLSFRCKYLTATNGHLDGN